MDLNVSPKLRAELKALTVDRRPLIVIDMSGVPYIDSYWEVARLYFAHLRSSPELVERARTELAGKQLACWCPQPGPCHGLILAALANGRELQDVEDEWRQAGMLAEQQELFA